MQVCSCGGVLGFTHMGKGCVGPTMCATSGRVWAKWHFSLVLSGTLMVNPVVARGRASQNCASIVWKEV